MISPHDSDEGLSKSTRVLLLAAGILFVVALSGLFFTLPGTGYGVRIRAAGWPAYRNVRTGEMLLEHRRTGAATLWFDRAIAADPEGRLGVLISVVDACERQSCPDLGLKYARQAAENYPSWQTLNREAEMLLANNDASAAASLFERVLQSHLQNHAGADAADVSGEAAAGLAYSLAVMKKDLSRAQKVAENGIQEELHAGGSPAVVARLNDSLACVHYSRWALAGASTELELARIYDETALQCLRARPDPVLARRIQRRQKVLASACDRTYSGAVNALQY